MIQTPPQPLTLDPEAAWAGQRAPLTNPRPQKSQVELNQWSKILRLVYDDVWDGGKVDRVEDWIFFDGIDYERYLQKNVKRNVYYDFKLS